MHCSIKHGSENQCHLHNIQTFCLNNTILTRYEVKHTHTHTLIDCIHVSQRKKKKVEKVQTVAYLTLSDSEQKACFCRFSSFIVSSVSSPRSLCSIHPTLAINLPHNKNIIEHFENHCVALFLVKDIDLIEIYWLAHRTTTQRKYVVFAHFNQFLAHCHVVARVFWVIILTHCYVFVTVFWVPLWYLVQHTMIGTH